MFGRRGWAWAGAVVVASALAGAMPATARSAGGHKSEKTLTTQEIARKCLPSIVSITVLNAQGEPSVQGSGFVIGPNLIATNVHVISNAHSVTANFRTGRSETVYGIVGIDASRDMCVLYANTSGITPLPLATLDGVEIGDPVTALGCPEGLGASVSTGIVSGIHNVKGTKIVQTTAPISHGSSGGALVDRAGRVLGITSFFYQDGQNLNFAYASHYLQDLRPRGIVTYTSWSELEFWEAKDQTSTRATPAAATAAPSAPAAPASFDADPLAGLNGVAVRIEYKSDALRQIGLTTEKVSDDAVHRLSDAGIKVFSKDDVEAGKCDAVLVITGDAAYDSSGLYAYWVSVGLEQRVELERDTPTGTVAIGWIRNDVGLGKPDQIPEVAQAKIDNMLSMFIKEYRQQNPPAKSK